MYIYINRCVCVCKHMYIYIYTYIYMYVYTHVTCVLRNVGGADRFSPRMKYNPRQELVIPGRKISCITCYTGK